MLDKGIDDNYDVSKDYTRVIKNRFTYGEAYHRIVSLQLTKIQIIRRRRNHEKDLHVAR